MSWEIQWERFTWNQRGLRVEMAVGWSIYEGRGAEQTDISTFKYPIAFAVLVDLHDAIDKKYMLPSGRTHLVPEAKTD
jgi:hypothetical protein